jgi:thioredoxin reductase (NADPH)
MAAPSKRSKVAIIGSGPAGHTAAIYAARAGLEPVMYEGFIVNGIAAGGQLTTTTELENFPSYPEGISGLEFTDRLRAQTLRFGTVIHSETIQKVDLSSRPFKLFSENNQSDEPDLVADAVIIATGATSKKLPAIDLDKYWQRGVSTCAVCDGALPIFRKKPLIVVGGGDSAMEEASYLSKLASKVYLVHRRSEFRASKIMQNRVKSNPNIEIIWNTEVTQVLGNEKVMTGVKLRNTETNEEKDLTAAGLFMAIGHTPNSSFLNGQVKLNEEGYVVTNPDMTTSVEGVFACGDVQDEKYRQAITAAGTGCIAALECERWLARNGL